MSRPDATAQSRFESLLQEHRRIVFHVARLYAGKAEDRDDLAQEICGQLWRAFPRYDPARKFSTWMYRIALNVGVSHLRRSGAGAARFEPWRDDLADTIEDESARPADERPAELARLIDGMDPPDRALMLLYLDDRPYAAIAEVLGLRETNVATKISRIKRRLREQMDGPPGAGATRAPGPAPPRAAYIRSIIACPKPEQDTCVAPVIRRAKSYVTTLSRMARSSPVSIFAAASFQPMWTSIIWAERISEPGFT